MLDVNRKPTSHTMTPYAATRVVNRELAKAGVKHPKTGQPKEVQPTMLYAYASQGKFERERASDGRWTVDLVTFNQWLRGYIERLIERQQHREDLSEKAQTESRS